MTATTHYANPDLIRKYAEGLTDQEIHCRIYGHSWRDETVDAGDWGYLIGQRCPNCLNEREQVITPAGYPVTGWKPRYQPGYLLPPGSGRLGQDGKAILRLVKLRHRGVMVSD